MYYFLHIENDYLQVRLNYHKPHLGVRKFNEMPVFTVVISMFLS